MNEVALFQKIHSTLLQAHNIVLLSHQNPDSDALGSITALSQFLESLGKKVFLFCPNAPHPNYLFLPHIEKVSTNLEQAFKEDIDLLVFLDSGDLHVAGGEKSIQRLKPSGTIINIDHHATNTNFGHINLVLPQAASTTEILYKFFRHENINITKEIATSLMAGILGDTSNFTNHNTTSESLAMASALLSSGAPLSSIQKILEENKTLPVLKHWGTILSRAFINKQFKVAITLVTADETKEFENQEEANEGIANFLNNISNVSMVLFIKEVGDGTIRGSLRTNDSLTDVSKLATMLGGGGHEKAAGFTVQGKLVKDSQGWKII